VWWLLCYCGDWLLILVCETKQGWRGWRGWPRRGLPSIFFTFGFNVVRDLWIGLSIWITAVRFDRRLELTAEVYSISRRLYFQLFFLFTNIPVQSYSSLRVLRRSILTAVMLGVTARPAKRERVEARSNAECCSEWAFLRRLCSGLLLGVTARPLFTLLSGAGNSVT
jgi:hypothetical protein